jgi:predicted RNA-binding Zn ribbon-like protein
LKSPKAVNKRTRGQGRTGAFPRLLASRLCLDFANTIEGPISPDPEDFLHDYLELVRWSWHARAIDAAELRRLSELAEEAPERASDVFKQALRLREAIDRISRAVAAGRAPSDDDLRTAQQEYLEALGAASLARDDHRFGWSWRGVDDLRLPLWRVAASALELLTEGDLGRVKQCPGADDCGWLFYDTSRNGTRRWCSMEGCGSRMKMRRHYAKHRQRVG